MTKRKPVTSAYTEAYNAVVESFKKKGSYLTVGEVQEAFESTPGLVFSPGTTIDEALGKLERWKLIAFLKPVGLEQKVVIPLNVD